MNRGEEARGLQARLLAGATGLGADLTTADARLLLDYLRLLDRWNARFNLTGDSGPGKMLDRHVLDSLSIAAWIAGETVVDAGSGAGLPGIPLAVLFPQKRFVLIDSNGKKTRFLFQAKLDLGLANIDIVHERIENFPGPADTVVCRALAGLGKSVEKTQHLLADGAILVSMRGRHPGGELARLPDNCKVAFVERLQVPGAASRHVVGIRHGGD